uniref:Cytochrome c oxidase subunit 3 n=1 Tax=Crassostrea ariakensis TaxID=3244846 RepID=D5FRS0_CRAAR|nr:cytochrome c oxidase subunit 3 [Crassostrea ariakensis]AIM52306.1 cytochrome c oxidase subunit III [Crassostrea ariakensis]AIM52319.1 cytochrome c oxidase subunit III [Crassostrea ariakensis]
MKSEYKLSEEALKNRLEEFIKTGFKRKAIIRTPYHVVDPSPWPMIMGANLWGIAAMFICWVNQISFDNLYWGIPLLVFTTYNWVRDIINEATFQGFHTEKVQSGLTLCFILFLISELMLFFSFFWAFFHSALSSSVEIGCCWPPVGLECLDWSKVPLHNTALLVASSASITLSHHYLQSGDIWLSVVTYVGTLGLSVMFIKNQYEEYAWSSFSISDGVYGSCFFMLTGLHGMHVIGGTCGLLFCLVRMMLLQFSTEHHIALTLAIWYWHFVDIVWLGLFFIIYIWGS